MPLLIITAAALAFCSMTAIALLIAIRIIRDLSDRYIARARVAIRRVMLSALKDQSVDRRDLKPLQRHPRLVAECLLEFAALVRGDARERLLNMLQHSGLLDRLMLCAHQRGPARQVWVEAISVFPRRAVEPFLRLMLTDAEPSVRLAAAGGLLSMEARLSLVETIALGDAGSDHSGQFGVLVRRVVINDVAACQSTLTEGTLSPLLRAMLIDALGLAGDYTSIPVILGHTGDADPVLRASAVLALGRLTHPMGVLAVQKALSDRVWCVRAAAAQAIGLGNFTSLVDPLTLCLRDPVWSVRYQVVAAMKVLGPRGRWKLDRAARSRDPQLRELAASALIDASAA
jgi:HEAT repeat protein